MKRFVLLFAAVLLSACGSSVKLDNTPVEDKTGTPVNVPLGDGNKAAGSSVGSGAVKGGKGRSHPCGQSHCLFRLRQLRYPR
jgi:hypothetical protein